MPDNPIAGLYPQPPQLNQQNALAGNPLDLVAKMNALQAFQAKKAVGQAAQSAINPDGTIDFNKGIAAIGSNPEAALGAQEGVSTFLAQRGQDTANNAKAFDLASGQSNYVQDKIGALIQNPKVTKDDVRKAFTDIAVSTGIPAPIINSKLAQLGPNPTPAQIQAWGRNISNMAQGAAATAQRTPNGYDVNGAPIVSTAGAVNATNSGNTYGLSQGLPEVASANYNALIQDQKNAASGMQNVRLLESAIPLAEKLGHTDFNKGSEELAQLKSLGELAGIKDQTLSQRQQLDKILHQFAGQLPNSERSDAGLFQALKSNPNLDLTQESVLSLLKKQIGYSKMDAAIPNEFLKQHPGATENEKQAIGVNITEWEK